MYEVGASFDYFLIDTYGEDKLKVLFRDIGTSHDLGKSTQAIFGQSLIEIEKAWKRYLKRISDETLSGALTRKIVQAVQDYHNREFI